MTIKFTATADFEAEITDDIAYEVMKFYGGNFKNWMEDNYEDYIEASDFEIEDGTFGESAPFPSAVIVFKKN